MNVTQVNEPISVLAKFSRGQIFPLKINWHGVTHKIVQVTGFWKSKEGQTEILHLSVVNENGTYYEISFNPKTFAWYLNQVEAE